MRCKFEENNMCIIVDRFVHPAMADEEGYCMCTDSDDQEMSCEWYGVD